MKKFYQGKMLFCAGRKTIGNLSNTIIQQKAKWNCKLKRNFRILKKINLFSAFFCFFLFSERKETSSILNFIIANETQFYLTQCIRPKSYKIYTLNMFKNALCELLSHLRHIAPFELHSSNFQETCLKRKLKLNLHKKEEE